MFHEPETAEFTCFGCGLIAHYLLRWRVPRKPKGDYFLCTQCAAAYHSLQGAQPSLKDKIDEATDRAYNDF